MDVLLFPLVVLCEGIAAWVDGRLDATWAEMAGRAGVGHRQGVTISAAVVGREVLVTASVRHYGRLRDNWAQVRVTAWGGEEDWETYQRREGQNICDMMARKLAMRER